MMPTNVCPGLNTKSGAFVPTPNRGRLGRHPYHGGAIIGEQAPADGARAEPREVRDLDAFEGQARGHRQASVGAGLCNGRDIALLQNTKPAATISFVNPASPPSATGSR